MFFTKVLVSIDARVVQRNDAASAANVTIVDRPLGGGGDPHLVLLVGEEVGRRAGLGADPGRRGGDPSEKGGNAMYKAAKQEYVMVA